MPGLLKKVCAIFPQLRIVWVVLQFALQVKEDKANAVIPELRQKVENKLAFAAAGLAGNHQQSIGRAWAIH